MSSELEYRPLLVSRNEIRILAIDPPIAENHDVPIKCHLQQVSLGQHEPYVALSYCWGDPRSKMHIDVGGMTVHITSSLGSALLELRRRRKYRVWADAICINQKDIEERSQQVLRMAAIYRYATQTVAWLGHESRPGLHDDTRGENASKLIDQLRTMVDKPKRRRKVFYREEDPVEKDKVPTSNESWAGFKELLSNPYWRRVWIIQEVAVALDVLLLWGRRFSVTVSSLRKAIAGCRMLRATNPSAATVVLLADFNHIREILHLRERERQASRVNLLSLLVRTRRAVSTDPKDKVFALLNLTSDGQSIVPAPNYLSKVEELNLDISLRMIYNAASLDPIVFPARTDAKNVWMPDWVSVEAWSDTKSNKYLSSTAKFVHERLLNNHGLKSGSSRIETKWSATNDLAPYHQLSSGCLMVRGKRLGMLSQCTAAYEEAMREDNAYDSRHLPRGCSTAWSSDYKILTRLCWLLFDLIPVKHTIRPENLDARAFHHLLQPENRYRQVAAAEKGFIQWLHCRKNRRFRIEDRSLLSWLSGDGGSSRESKLRPTPRGWHTVAHR